MAFIQSFLRFFNSTQYFFLFKKFDHVVFGGQLLLLHIGLLLYNLCFQFFDLFQLTRFGRFVQLIAFFSQEPIDISDLILY